MAVVAGIETFLDVGQCRGVRGKIRFLRQVTHRYAGLDKAGAVVRLDETGSDLQERRLAGAVAPDQTHAFACGHRKIGTLQERRTAKGQGNTGELDEGWRHRA